jgi:WD40 repeat protein
MAVCAFTSQALYPQCNLAATGGLDTTIRIWDRTTMCVIYEVTEHNDSITAICFASSLVAHVVVEVKRVVNTKQIQGEFFGEKTKI